jgi:O-acetyl-ADP-ribose deacetylase (regulator of RNase III)
MKIYLRDRNYDVTDAWHLYFDNNEDFNISCGDIFDEGEHMNCEGIVSPANSFGFMDGGIDYVYSEYFGWEMSEKLRRTIYRYHNGELLVGNAEVVNIEGMSSSGLRYLISAPTMRVPMNISNTVNVYLAFRAALIAAEKYKMSSILCPGLGTAIGKVPPMLAALQMDEAYQNFISPQPVDILGVASRNHNKMLYMPI